MKLTIFFFSIISISLFASYEWTHSAGDYNSQRYSKNIQINEENIQDLKVAWEFSSKGTRNKTPIQSSPIFTGDKIVSLGLNKVFAVNPSDGSLIWETLIKDSFPFQLDTAAKGITYNSEKRKSIFVPTNQGIVEINEENGEILNHFYAGPTAVPPVVHGNKIIIATRWDGVKAYDLNNKMLLWQIETTKNGYSSHIWSGFSYNKELEIAFVVTGSSGGVTGWYRNDPNLDNTILAIDTKKGQLKWSFQHIDHDLWDLDIVGNPMTFKVNIDGNLVHAVVALTKTGDVIYLNAISGNPIFQDSFENVRVPISDVPNEKSAQYQKKFIKPQPFTSTYIDIDKEFSHLSGENLEYGKKFVVRNQAFSSSSLNHDVILLDYMVEQKWPGGSINFSEENPSLIVPYNRDPWIIRTYYRDNLYRAVEVIYNKFNSIWPSNNINISENIFENNCASCHVSGQAPNKFYLANLSKEYIYEVINSGSMSQYTAGLNQQEIMNLSEYLSQNEIKKSDKIFQSLPLTPSNIIYEESCQSCHGNARRGFHENEGSGDQYIPPLVGITLTEKNEFVQKFDEVKKLHSSSEITLDISKVITKKYLKSFMIMIQCFKN